MAPWKGTVVISEANRIKLRKLAIKVTGISHLDSTFVNRKKVILNFTIAFEKRIKEKSVAIGDVNSVENMLSCDFLTGMSAQSYYQQNRWLR